VVEKNERIEMQAETLALDSLGTTPEFDDFNFSSSWDPAMKRRISQAALAKLVIRAREPDQCPMTDIADAMYFTLRPAAFEAYQRWNGPVAINYREWFYLKLGQFLRILLFDQLEVRSLADDSRKRMRLPIEKGCEITGVHCRNEIGLDELSQSIYPEDNDEETWFRLIEAASYNPDNRLPEVREWLRTHRRTRASAKSRSTKNEPRDALIRHELSQGTERSEICRKLDEAGIATTLGLQKLGFTRWLDGWSDPEDGRPLVQPLFSKVARR
jgi:hypothetical protein